VEPEQIGTRLRDAAAPDEEAARERALARVRAELADARPVQRRGGRLPLALAAATLALLAALSPPGDAVADWVRGAVGLRTHEPTRPARVAGDRTPSGGRLLVTSGGTAWIVEADGDRRRLGAWTGAGWSPHGRFVVAWRGRRLAALDPRGRVRWSLLAPRVVQSAVWAPSGFRIAYRAGGELRVVAGDGTGDRSLGRSTFSPMVWRPGPTHVLAHASGSHLDVLDVDLGRRLARIQLPHVTGGVAWSADGRRLYANLHRSIAVYDARGRRTGRIWMPGRQTVTTFVPARAGSLVAVARHGGGVSEIALMGPRTRSRVLFRGDGRFTRLRFSPNGHWLLAAWPLADQWVYLRPGDAGAARVLTAPGVTRRFRAAGFPQLSGWAP
jgi:hypothetical protein